MDLKTEYLGLKLANPLVPSASPLSRDIDKAKRLEDAGAAAIVMYSLFEEEVEKSEAALNEFLHHQDIGFGEADGFAPPLPQYASIADDYLAQVFALKQALDIPVIASLNGVSTGGWVEYGAMLEESGADALELNIYHVAASLEQSGAEIEQRYIDILSALRSKVNLPITVKLFSQFSALPHFISRLEQAGANGVSLFNRFYEPDIDLERLQVLPTLSLSSSQELLLRMHWVALLYGRVELSLAVTGGIYTAEDALKALMAGADITHLCSSLLVNGTGHLGEILDDIQHWMEVHEYESISQLKGSMSHRNAPDPVAYERANYVQMLENFSKRVRGEA